MLKDDATLEECGIGIDETKKHIHIMEIQSSTAGFHQLVSCEIDLLPLCHTLQAATRLSIRLKK